MMDEHIEHIFNSGAGIDLVFNIDSDAPRALSSIVLDADFRNNTLFAAQTTPPVTPNFTYDQMHVTTLESTGSGEKKRQGLSCSITRFMNKYKLANGSFTVALQLLISPPLKEVNIRSAFRLKPGLHYSVMGKVIYGKQEFYSGDHFGVHDISNTGMAILIPKLFKTHPNPFLNITVGASVKIGLVLKSQQEEAIDTLSGIARVVRIQMQFNKTHALMGLFFHPFSGNQEARLSRFIHEAQLDEIRRLNWG
ncbi:MAG: hypothetical protein CSA22_00925 [Deltaproteobacteria bacterium]|nr:MAG: hypothetical protein CSA22_00925 [Deltaproteobacteria bacterium]